MSSLIGRLESKITVPSGNWTAALTESGGGGAKTITFLEGESYYWNSAAGSLATFPTVLAQKLTDASADAGNNNTYTCTISDDETGTGKLTLAASAGTFTLTSVSSALLSLIGFSADLSPTAASFTSGQAIEGMWLPGCPLEQTYGLASSGQIIQDRQVTLSEDGTYYAYSGAGYRRDELVFPVVTAARTLVASESVTSESFQQFWLDAIRGEAAWATPGQGLRYYRDCTDDLDYVDFACADGASPRYERNDPGSIEYWQVTISVVNDDVSPPIGRWEYVGHAEVVGFATHTIPVEGLNGNKDGAYLFIAHVVTGGASRSWQIRPNGLTTNQANVRGSTVPGLDTDAFWAFSETGRGYMDVTITVFASTTIRGGAVNVDRVFIATPRVHADSPAAAATIFEADSAGIWSDTSTNMTSLPFVSCSDGSTTKNVGYAVGTVISMYRRAQ